MNNFKKRVVTPTYFVMFSVLLYHWLLLLIKGREGYQRNVPILVTSSLTLDCEIVRQQEAELVTQCELMRIIHQIASCGRRFYLVEDSFNLFLVKS